jgi:glycine/D-amino acid oxidase-like deaminating enzyme
LPSKIVDKLIPSGFGVSDLNRLLVYYRRGPKNRILIGGRGSLWRPKSVKAFNGLETMLTKVYPILRDIKIEYRWYGNVSITSNFMPKINILGSRAISFLGCNGRGVAISPAIGPYLSDWLINGKDNNLPLPISKNIKTIPLHSIHRLYVALISAYYKARDWVD